MTNTTTTKEQQHPTGYTPRKYSEELSDEVAYLHGLVRKDKLPIEDRIKALEYVTDYYALAQAEHHETLTRPPISLRDSYALIRCADLLMHGYLTWSHHDKMNIVENPILSDSQLRFRRKKESVLADVYTGKGDVTIGRHKDEFGVKRRIYDYMTPKKDNGLIDGKTLDLYIALDDAGLTDRQRQAIDLVYFEGMTQEAAGEELGVTQQAIVKFIRAGVAKIQRFYNEGVGS